MKDYKALALREITIKKSTSLIIFFAFMVSAFMVVSIALSVPLVQKLSRQQFERTQGNWHIRLETDAMPEDMLSDSDFESAGYSCSLGMAFIRNTGLSLSVEYYDETARDQWKTSFQLLDGEFPKKKGEIVLEERDFELFGIPEKLGQKITLEILPLHGGEKVSREYEVCGILDTCRKVALLGGHMGLISEEEATEETPEKNYYIRMKDAKKLESREYVDNLTEKYHAGSWKCNEYLLQAYGIFPAGTERMDYYATWLPLALVGGLVLLAAGLVVYNVLKIFLIKRMEQYGTLRAIGADRYQIYIILSRYILILLLAAFPFGILFGSFGARAGAVIVAKNWSEILLEEPGKTGLTKLLGEIPVFSWRAVFIAAAVLSAFAAVAFFPVIHSITKLSPIEAMQGYRSRIKKTRGRKRRIKDINRYLARLNMSRNRGRAFLTVTSMAISIICMAGVTGYYQCKEVQMEYNISSQGDYAVTAPVGTIRDMMPEEAAEALKKSGYTAADIQNLRQKCTDCLVIPQVYFTLPYGYLGATEKFPEYAGKISLFGLDKEGVKYFAPDLTEEAVRKLEDGKGVLYYRYGAKGNLEEDQWRKYVDYAMERDILTIAGSRYEILYDIDFEPNAKSFVNLNSPYGNAHLFLPDKIFCSILSMEEPRYSQVNIIMGKNADKSEVATALDEFCEAHPGSGFQDFYTRRQEFAAERKSTRDMGYLLAVLIAVTGIFNIATTSHENLYARMKEMGMYRAVGMSREDLEKSFLWEGLFYGLFSAAAGFLGGTVLTWFLSAAFFGENWMNKTVIANIPWGMLTVTGVTVVLICVASIWIPLRRIKRMNIVECLRFME